MSKQQIKKFRKTDYSYDDEEVAAPIKNFLDKRKEKRVDRALRTKDLSALLEDEEDDYPFDSIYDEMDYEDSWPDESERR